MELSEIKNNWTFTKNIGATSYWFEDTDDGSGKTIGPEEVLEIGCQLKADNLRLSDALSAAQVFAIELKAENAALKRYAVLLDGWFNADELPINVTRAIGKARAECADTLLVDE